jgi:hypothetical protein
MLTFTRGDIATLILLSTFAAGCPADDPSDDPSSSSGSDPATTDPSTSTDPSSDPTTDPSTSTDPSSDPTTDPSTSTDPTTDPSASTTDDGSDSTGVDSTGDESTTEAAGLEIVGDWADEFGGVHIVTETTWVTSYGKDAFPYTISEYDNVERWVIAQDDVDDTWTKYEWTYAEDDLWYCQSTFGEASAEDAMNAPAADPADPASAGCGGFAWSRLTPM